MCSQTAGVSAMASITSGVKSCGCGDGEPHAADPVDRSDLPQELGEQRAAGEPGTVTSRP